MQASIGARRAVTVLAMLLLIVIVAACSSSDVPTLDDDDATASPTAKPAIDDPQEAMLAFADCMRENGVDMPDPGVDAVGDAPPATVIDPHSDEFRAAEDACRHLLGGIEPMEPGDAPPLSQEEEEAFLAFAECMREHGIDMPDPGSGGAILVPPGQGGSNMDPTSDEFREAEAECRTHLEDVLRDAEEVAP